MMALQLSQKNRGLQLASSEKKNEEEKTQTPLTNAGLWAGKRNVSVT